MLIAARNAAWGGKRKPYDAEVEYLESTGTQWIDTGVMPDYTLTATFDVEVLPTTTLIRFSGSRVRENPSFMFSLSNTAGLINDYGSGRDGNRLILGSFNPSNHIGHLSLEFGNRYIKNLSTGQTIISGSTVGPTSAGLPPRPMLLWALQDNTVVLDGSIGRIFSVRYFKQNSLVRDFIPVRKDNVGYMYDKVSSKLFGNAGTGKFVLGADL
jgi:hypothetical protein